MRRRANSEGTIRQRGDGRWEALITLSGGHRRSFYGKTQQEALKKMQAAKRAVQDGLPVASDRTTLEAFLRQWFKDTVIPSLAPYTVSSYKSLIELHLIPGLGRIKLGSLTAQEVQGFMNGKLESGSSPRTVQYMHAVLRRALGQAEKWGMIPRNVAKFAVAPKVPRAKVEPLKPVESKKLLSEIRGDRLEALYTVALALGLRQGEALGLQWADLNLEAGTLSVKRSLQRIDGRYVLAPTKTERSARTLKLPEICWEALRAHRAAQEVERETIGEAWHGDWDLVFCHADGSPLSRHAETRRFQRILSDAGIEKHRFHDLRHTCATLLLAQGVELRVIMETLGHTQIATTADIYSHVLPVLMADAAAKMDAILTGD